MDQTPTLLGQGAVRDRVFCHFPHGGPEQAANIPGFLPGTWVRRGDWKLIRFFADNDDGSDRFELYNLKDDLGETKNLAAEKPELVARTELAHQRFPARHQGRHSRPQPGLRQSRRNARRSAARLEGARLRRHGQGRHRHHDRQRPRAVLRHRRGQSTARR